MSVFLDFHNRVSVIRKNLVDRGLLPEESLNIPFTVDLPKDNNHGDITTNIAMVLAKVARKAPKDLGAEFVEEIKKIQAVSSVELVNPGFINIKLNNQFWHGVLEDVLEKGIGNTIANIGQGRGVNVEYVSANPTGPLHVGHVRGAVVGDVLANLLIKVGFKVTKEYYVNDAGGQIKVLSQSLFFRYQELFGIEQGDFPEDCYPGEYLIDCAKKLREQDGDKWLGKKPEEYLEYFSKFSVVYMVDLIKKDLEDLRIKHDLFSYESKIATKETSKEVVDSLSKKGLIYKGILDTPKGIDVEDFEAREQFLFKSTDFGDDTDRAILKSDGSNTYFMGDIVYHYNKYKRGGALLIDVLGADHSGYVKRIKAAVQALTDGKGELEVMSLQMVKLMDNGVPVAMSKRAGNFVTLKDIVEKVGCDAVRYSMILRQADSPIFFDFAKSVEKSRENPLFYIQYANARISSVMDNLKNSGIDLNTKGDFSLLNHPLELDLIKLIARYPMVMENVAKTYEIHKITNFLNDVASLVHTYWNAGKEDEKLKFIQIDNKILTISRVLLLQSVKGLISDAFEVLGIVPIEDM